MRSAAKIVRYQRVDERVVAKLVFDISSGSDITQDFEDVDGAEDGGVEKDGPAVVVHQIGVKRKRRHEVHHARRRRHLDE